MGTQDVVHSVSSTRTYERCPARYRFAYLDGVEPSRLAPAAWRFGSVVHDGLEAAYRYRWAHGSVGPMLDCLPAAFAAVDRAWEGYAMGRREGLRNAKNMTARQLLTQPVSGPSILGVEELLTADIGAIRIAGYADLIVGVGDAVEIRDHKVTSDERTAEELAADFQLNLYGWLARRRWSSATEIRAAHCYPRSGRIVRTRLHDQGLQQARDRVQQTAARVAADGVFAPRPAEHCGSCRWLDRCPAGRRQEADGQDGWDATSASRSPIGSGRTTSSHT